MSQTQNVEIAQNVEAKKERKPILSDKYSKFLVSNFNLIRLLESQGLLSQEGVEAAYSEIRLMSPIEDQIEYYEAFLADVKGSKGNPGVKSQMKKYVTQRNKPPKVPRAKKERKPKEQVVETAPTDETKPKKERKPRAKKETKISDESTNDVVAELVEAANSSMDETVEQPVVEPVKKARKPRAKKEAPVEEALVEEDKKTKKSKTKKVEESPQEEESIHTNEFVLDGKTYLIDSDNNLYDINSHEEVGVYDATTSTIVA
jgi:hypothetical protein